MKTTVAYYFAGPAGNSPGIGMGFEFSVRHYETQPFIPEVGSAVALSFGSDLAQSAIFNVKSVKVNLASDEFDLFEIYVDTY